MKREIKFRAWDKHRGKKGMMLENHTFHTIAETGLHSLEHLVWMQFTGLHDKNGKEIYEGDIAEWVFRYGDFMDEVKRTKVEIHPLANSNYLKDCALIGNIYENPELLEQ